MKSFVLQLENLFIFISVVFKLVFVDLCNDYLTKQLCTNIEWLILLTAEYWHNLNPKFLICACFMNNYVDFP